MKKNKKDINTGFQVSAVEPIDRRLVLSKDQMKNIDESTMPGKYFAVCLDDGRIYEFNSNRPVAEVSDETGKFKAVKGSLIPLSDAEIDEIFE